MPDTHQSDLVSKYMAIQYGLLVVGVVLLLVATYNYGQSCGSQVVEQPAAAGMYSNFAAKPKRRPPAHGSNHKHGRLSEDQIAEGFLSYRADQSAMEFGTTYDVPTDENGLAEPYDPAKDSLEQSVFDSHKEFVDESNLSTQGPNSGNVERDDTNEVVKRVGLRRVDYTSIYSGDDARTVSSEYPSQVAQDTTDHVFT